MFSISFENSNAGAPRLVAGYGTLRVRRLAWSALGGADTAEIEAAGGANVSGLLGCPVRVESTAGEPLWWGYVSELAARGGDGAVVSLDGLANRVAAAYRANGALLMTTWKDDHASQLDYGIHERVVRAGDAARAEAERLRDAVLAQSGRPRVSLRDAGGQPGWLLRCRGWWHALDWRAAAQFSGGARHDQGGGGWALLGSGVENARVGQSFRLALLPQRLSALALRLRIAGSPSDSLRVQVCADSSGLPGAVLGQALIPAAAISAGAAWVTASFDPGIDLAAGAPYWLVASRSGAANATAYYLLEKDSGGGYAEGALRVYGSGGWGAVSGESLLFRAESLPEAAALLRGWVAACAPALVGVRFEGSLAARSGGYPGEVLTAREALERLLRAGDGGRRLLAEITAQRWMRVIALPDPGERDWMLAAGGILLDAGGQPLPPYRHAAGRWLRLEQPGLPQTQRVFVERCVYDAQNGRMRLEMA